MEISVLEFYELKKDDLKKLYVHVARKKTDQSISPESAKLSFYRCTQTPAYDGKVN